MTSSDRILDQPLADFVSNRGRDFISGKTTREFKYDPLLGFYVGPKGKKTCREIWGRGLPFRDWHNLRQGLGKVRSALCPTGAGHTTNIELPEDCIFKINTSGSSISILSKQNEIALKADSHIFAKHHTDCLVKAAERFEGADMSEYVPAILKSGSEGAVHYCCSDVARTRDPLFRTRHGLNWPGFLKQRIIPVLQRFYDRDGVRVVSGTEWAEMLRVKLQGRKVYDEIVSFFENTLDELNSVESPMMPIGFFSGDFQPQNVHVNGKQITFLDWSNCESGSLLIDIFADVFYPAMREPTKWMDYWCFLNGKLRLADTGLRLQNTAYVWMDWIKSWNGIKSNETLFRLQLKGMCWDWLLTMKHPWNPETGMPWMNYFVAFNAADTQA